MPYPAIEEGFGVFPASGRKAVGAVRRVAPSGRPELLIYIENAGDFTVPLSAISRVEIQKVILDMGKLDANLQQAIGRAHDAEDPAL